MDKEQITRSSINLNITENHNLLYFNIPREIVQKLHLTENDLLEYDVRESQFFFRRKGSQSLPKEIQHNIFSGLQVERNITRNNTVLRTNLPKEVAQPLAIQKGDSVAIAFDGKVIVGHKKHE
jgi:antitoxin component of MazEF toxin-antitoxin module